MRWWGIVTGAALVCAGARAAAAATAMTRFEVHVTVPTICTPSPAWRQLRAGQGIPPGMPCAPQPYGIMPQPTVRIGRDAETGLMTMTLEF